MSRPFFFFIFWLFYIFVIFGNPEKIISRINVLPFLSVSQTADKLQAKHKNRLHVMINSSTMCKKQLFAYSIQCNFQQIIC